VIYSYICGSEKKSQQKKAPEKNNIPKPSFESIPEKLGISHTSHTSINSEIPDCPDESTPLLNTSNHQAEKSLQETIVPIHLIEATKEKGIEEEGEKSRSSLEPSS
jgi:hypothetical protein